MLRVSNTTYAKKMKSPKNTEQVVAVIQLGRTHYLITRHFGCDAYCTAMVPTALATPP